MRAGRFERGAHGIGGEFRESVRRSAFAVASHSVLGQFDQKIMLNGGGAERDGEWVAQRQMKIVELELHGMLSYMAWRSPTSAMASAANASPAINPPPTSDIVLMSEGNSASASVWAAEKPGFGHLVKRGHHAADGPPLNRAQFHEPAEGKRIRAGQKDSVKQEMNLRPARGLRGEFLETQRCS